MEFMFQLWPPKNFPVTLDYQIVDVTSTAGQDYTAPVSGTLTIYPNSPQVHLDVILVNDGVAEPTEPSGCG